eukprot:3857716-Pleurochrysis_carterae.AAC.3
MPPFHIERTWLPYMLCSYDLPAVAMNLTRLQWIHLACLAAHSEKRSHGWNPAGAHPAAVFSAPNDHMQPLLRAAMSTKAECSSFAGVSEWHASTPICAQFGWNGALVCVRALAENRIGSRGILQLAEALKHNKTLTDLKLKGSLCLAYALAP